MDFHRVNASHGKSGDIAFTSFHRSSGMESNYTFKSAPAGGLYAEYNGEVPIDNQMINSTAKLYKQQLKDILLKKVNNLILLVIAMVVFYKLKLL